MNKRLTLARLRRNIFLIGFIFCLVTIIVATAFIHFNAKEKIINRNHDAFYDRSQVLESAIVKNTNFVYVMRNIYQTYIDKKLTDNELSQYIDDIQQAATNDTNKNYHQLNVGNSIGSYTVNNTIFSSGSSDKLNENYVQLLLALLNMQNFQAAALKRNPSLIMSYFLSNGGHSSSLYPNIPIQEIIKNFDDLKVFTSAAYEVYDDLAPPNVNPAAKHFWTEPYLDRAGNGMMVTCAIPTYDNGQYNGVIGADITLDFLNKFVKKSAVLSGNSFLISPKGYIITASDISYQNEGELVLFNEMIKNEQLEVNNILFEHSLENAPWKYIYFISKQTITNQALKESKIYNTVMFIALMALIIGYFSVNNFFIKPAISTEKQLKKLNRSLHSTQDKLQQNLVDLKNTQQKMIESEKLAALGVLVTGMAHEINTPLGVAITSNSCAHENCETIKKKFTEDGMTKNDFTQFLTAMDESSLMVSKNLNRVAELVKNFKSISAQSHYYALSKFNFNEYINHIVKVIKNLHPQMPHKITISCDDFTIESYEVAFDQIITNLIDNSIDHAFAGKQQGKINISVLLKEKNIELHYSDNGKGVSNDEKSKIFEPFYTSQRAKNTGLGLFIVHNIVTEKLKGQVEVIEEQQQGLALKISWPT